MGKFKNKKTVIKTIEWNEKGDLMINGKPALKMRIPKKAKKVVKESDFDWVDEFDHSQYYLKNPYVGMEYTDNGDDDRVIYTVKEIVEHNTRRPYMVVTWANGKQEYADLLLLSHYFSRVDDGQLTIVPNIVKESEFDWVDNVDSMKLYNVQNLEDGKYYVFHAKEEVVDRERPGSPPPEWVDGYEGQTIQVIYNDRIGRRIEFIPHGKIQNIRWKEKTESVTLDHMAQMFVYGEFSELQGSLTESEFDWAEKTPSAEILPYWGGEHDGTEPGGSGRRNKIFIYTDEDGIEHSVKIGGTKYLRYDGVGGVRFYDSSITQDEIDNLNNHGAAAGGDPFFGKYEVEMTRPEYNEYVRNGRVKLQVWDNFYSMNESNDFDWMVKVKDRPIQIGGMVISVRRPNEGEIPVDYVGIGDKVRTSPTTDHPDGFVFTIEDVREVNGRVGVWGSDIPEDKRMAFDGSKNYHFTHALVRESVLTESEFDWVDSSRTPQVGETILSMDGHYSKSSGFSPLDMVVLNVDGYTDSDKICFRVMTDTPFRRCDKISEFMSNINDGTYEYE
jgi:hypothetical protein